MSTHNICFLLRNKKDISIFRIKKAPYLLLCAYSKTSMTQIPMARLPWLIRTHFLSPYEILSIALEKKYLGNFSYFIMKLYVKYSY